MKRGQSLTAFRAESERELREVLRHAALATEARLARRFAADRSSLAVGACAVDRSAEADARQPGEQLGLMESLVARVHAEHGETIEWHGRHRFLVLLEAGSPAGARTRLDTIRNTATTSLGPSIRLRWGVAHAMETNDPLDLVLLAAFRCQQDDQPNGSIVDDADPAWAEQLIALSPGEEARLALIAQNRERGVDALLREAISMLLDSRAT